MIMRQWALAIALSLGIGMASAQSAPGEALGWLPEEAVASFRIDFKNLWRGPPLQANFRRGCPARMAYSHSASVGSRLPAHWQ